MSVLQEPLQDLFHSSKRVILDLTKIADDTPDGDNIRLFFEDSTAQNIDPKLPENRQKFNNNMLDNNNCRYLIGQYCEDRSAMLQGSTIAQEGRTYHLGMDIFCKDLEKVFAPCDGEMYLCGKRREQ